MRDQHWQHFPHGEDVGVRGFGDTLGGAFEQAAKAMMAAIVDPDSVADSEAVEIDCEASEPGQLLLDWLNALNREMSSRGMLFGRFEAHVDDGRLRARAWGEPADAEKHRPRGEIKGATGEHLHVAQRPNGQWVAECLIDL